MLIIKRKSKKLRKKRLERKKKNYPCTKNKGLTKSAPQIILSILTVKLLQTQASHITKPLNIALSRIVKIKSRCRRLSRTLAPSMTIMSSWLETRNLSRTTLIFSMRSA